MDINGIWKDKFFDSVRFAFGLRLLLTFLILGISIVAVLAFNFEIGALYLLVIGILVPVAIYAYSGYRAFSKSGLQPLRAALAVLLGALFYSAITSWNGDMGIYALSIAAEALAGAVFGFAGAWLAGRNRRTSISKKK